MKRKSTPTNIKLRPELHHWWPKSLSVFWAGSDGKTTRIDPTGAKIRQKPAKFAAIKNAHHVDLEGPWTHTFEPHFNDADSYFPHLINELLQMGSKHNEVGRDYASRLTGALILSPESIRMMPECLASLVVRSPRFRNIILQMVRHYGFYGDELTDRDIIVSSNIGHCFPAITQAIANCDFVFIMYSDTKEFYFGDGFFNNFTTSGDPISNARLVVPLTPQMAIGCFSNPRASNPGIRSIRLKNNEIDELNSLTQIYSLNYMFYRDTNNIFQQNYFDGAFKSLKDHRWAPLERMAEPYF